MIPTPAIYTPSEADKKFAEAQTERARLQAAAYLPQLLDIVAEKALESTASSKAVLDAAEFAYKVSGLAKRQEEVRNVPSFSVRIILPGQNKEVIIGGGSVHEDKAALPTLSDDTDSETDPIDVDYQALEAVPEYVVQASIPMDDDDLDLNLDDLMNDD